MESKWELHREVRGSVVSAQLLVVNRKSLFHKSLSAFISVDLRFLLLCVLGALCGRKAGAGWQL